MISFTTLTILLGLGAGIIIAGLCRLLTKNPLTLTVIAAIAFAATFGLSRLLLSQKYEIWSVQYQINDIPLMAAIKKYHPKEYNDLMSKVADSIQLDDRSQNWVANGYVMGNKLFISDLKTASDEAIYQYLLTLHHAYVYINKSDPSLVVKLEHPDLSVIMSIEYLKSDPEFKKLFDTAMQAKRNLVKAAIESPVPLPNVNVAAPMLNTLLNQLKAKYGAQAVSGALGYGNGTTSPQVQASVILDFYQSLLNMNRADAGLIMRYIGMSSDNKAS